MDCARLAGDPPVEIVLRRSARARRYSLRVSALDGRVTLTLPLRGSAAEGLAFARDRETWIRAALARQPDAATVGFGTVLTVEGRALTLTPAPVRGPRIEGPALLLPPDPARAAARTAAFLRELARDRLAAASDRHAAALGRRITRISLRDTRSRWGSCTHDGALMYSWRLILAPPEVLDYVAAHEVAHLAEMNHSAAFWAVVARLCPGWKERRNWLRRDGASLHRWRFD
jgi:predicted metal-dependent hydrolase